MPQGSMGLEQRQLVLAGEVALASPRARQQRGQRGAILRSRKPRGNRLLAQVPPESHAGSMP